MPSSKSNDKHRQANVARGRLLEKMAARFFSDKGFDILDKNWQAGHKELDLIVRKDNLIVFVEVKSASSLKFGHPSERVDQKKIHNLTLAAQQYLLAHEISECDKRFDLITFVDGQLEHYPDAFQASHE